MTTESPAAVLWDMDGTIVDTEPYWMLSETRLVESFGGVWTYDDCMSLVGSGLGNSARILQSRGVRLSEDEIIERMTDEVVARLSEEVPWRPGALELLSGLADAGIRLGLVTMSFERMARAVAESMPFDVFDVVVSGDMVSNSKPHPEPYLLAARRLGVGIEECVAIEDSHAGLASAVSSGAATIGVPHQLLLEEGAQYSIWPTLAGRTVDDIRALYSLHAARRSFARDASSFPIPAPVSDDHLHGKDRARS